MELLQRLQKLDQEKKLTPDEIIKITSAEELKFLLLEARSKGEGDPNNLYSFFSELRSESIKGDGMNIFQEHLTIKFFYLKQMYLIDEVILYALMHLIGPIVLDFYLETEILSDDKLFDYYIKKYHEYKNNQEFTIFKLLDRLNINDLKLEGEELQKLLAKMAELADTPSDKTN